MRSANTFRRRRNLLSLEQLNFLFLRAAAFCLALSPDAAMIALLIGALLDHYFLMGLAAGLVIVGFAVAMIDIVRSSLSRARRSAAVRSANWPAED